LRNAVAFQVGNKESESGPSMLAAIRIHSAHRSFSRRLSAGAAPKRTPARPGRTGS
jgi:hypothetical protein